MYSLDIMQDLIIFGSILEKCGIELTDAKLMPLNTGQMQPFSLYSPFLNSIVQDVSSCKYVRIQLHVYYWLCVVYCTLICLDRGSCLTFTQWHAISPSSSACNLDSGGTQEGTKCPLALDVQDRPSCRPVACMLNKRPLWPSKHGTGDLIQTLLWI